MNFFRSSVSLCGTTSVSTKEEHYQQQQSEQHQSTAKTGAEKKSKMKNKKNNLSQIEMPSSTVVTSHQEEYAAPRPTLTISTVKSAIEKSNSAANTAPHHSPSKSINSAQHLAVTSSKVPSITSATSTSDESSDEGSSLDGQSETASVTEHNDSVSEPEPRQNVFVRSCCCCFKSLFPSWRKSLPKPEEQYETIKLLLLGLDNAGKTTVALHLAGESVEDVVSTIGFSNYELKADNFRPPVTVLHNSKKADQIDDQPPNHSGHKQKFRIILYDLGGGRRIRSIWKNYYSLVHGILFVIDSADIERILEVKELLQEVVASSKVAGKPILIYLNKQDLHDAMDEIDICKFTNLEELVSQYKCITKIEPISARNVPSAQNGLNGTRVGVDPALEASFRWLLDFIEDNWAELDGRVAEDSNEQIANEHNSLRARIDRTKTKQQYIEIETNVPIKTSGGPLIESGSSVDDSFRAATRSYLEAAVNKTPARLSPIEEVGSTYTGDDSSEEYNRRSLTEMDAPLDIEYHNQESNDSFAVGPVNIKGIMKKTGSNDSNKSQSPPTAAVAPQPQQQQQQAMVHPPMEIIITQPGSGGSGTSSNDSRLALNLVSRNNKIYPS